ncbi:hypothetical protein [Amycolatopsis oliviviridis]|uniref:Uncharacterized protein n=1 Tax=Amycolatopsis oliviviridis TaxID=1471590 RepID=A0ABQ3M9P8_9PSEU|nr:hypothetical protein [Amycolatopsis oliviviridis]GHH30335.1 hypothetical protein GCM10017790_63920 [Amycolatopsis oliviviridis]
MKARGDYWRKQKGRKRPTSVFIATQFFWIGPVEFVVLDVLRTGRVGAEAVVFSAAVMLAALSAVTSIRLAVRAGLDLFARLVFLPSHAWSSIMAAVDLAVLASAWFLAGRAGRGKGNG